MDLFFEKTEAWVYLFIYFEESIWLYIYETYGPGHCSRK